MNARVIGNADSFEQILLSSGLRQMSQIWPLAFRKQRVAQQYGTLTTKGHSETSKFTKHREFVSEALQRSGGVVGAGDDLYPILDLPDTDCSFDIDDGLSDDVVDPSQPIMLPDPDLASLTEIDNAVRLANSTAASRDNLARFVIAKDYIRKLVPLVEVAEDLESLQDLHKLCTIVRTLILLNDHTILDHVVTDELFMGVVGALECKIHNFPTKTLLTYFQTIQTFQITKPTTDTTYLLHRDSRKLSK